MSLIKGNLKSALGAQLGVLSVPFTLPKMLKKRRYIQKNIRKVTDQEINKYVLRNPRLSYYYFFFNNPKGYRD